MLVHFLSLFQLKFLRCFLLVKISVLSWVSFINLTEMSILEVLCIKVKVFVLLVVKMTHKKSSDISEKDRHAKRAESSCYLYTSLLEKTVACWEKEVSV